MSHLAAYSTQSGRVMPHIRAGANTSRSGASERVPTSKRTWSLPFPVQPCATVSAPWLRAWSTRCRTMSGRDSAETKGDLFSYLALARIPGTQNSSASSRPASITTASTAPAASARWRVGSHRWGPARAARAKPAAPPHTDPDRLDRPGGERALADRFPLLGTRLGVLADVDDHRHHLDPELLDH